MALTVGIGLLTTRWANQVLGQSDFGIWAGLTITVGVLLVFPDGVSAPFERFLSFEIGRGDPTRQRQIFGTGVAVMLAIALLALLVGLPLGKLVIAATFSGEKGLPVERAAGSVLLWAYSM